MEIEYVKTINVIPYEKNAKRHPEKQVQQLADSISAFGFKVPIVIDKNNIVIAGHGRLEAALKLGLAEVPVIRAEDLDEQKVKAFRLSDNKLSESGYDMGLVLDEMNELSIPLQKLTGFDIEKLNLEAGEGSGGEKEGDEKSTKHFTFTMTYEQAKVLKKAIDRAMENKVDFETFGNFNEDGNALHYIMNEWLRMIS